MGGMNSFRALISESFDKWFRKFDWEMVKLWPNTVPDLLLLLTEYTVDSRYLDLAYLE